MSFLSDFGRTFRSAFDGAVKAGRQIIRASAPVVRKVMEAARDAADELVRRVQRMRGDPNSEREVVERQLQEVNARIARLRASYERNGELSPREREEWRRLKKRREQLIEDIENLDSAEFAADVADDESEFAATEVGEGDAHLIDMVTGQSTFGKKCRICSRAMVLQWDRRVGTPGLKDFFWGCSGWYVLLANGRHACRYSERLGKQDFSIFANVKKPEFQVSANELSRRVLDPARKQRLREVMDGIRQQNKQSDIGIAHYRCPVHGESLRLQRKGAAADSVLDEYFLGCPRWLPDQKGCNFLIKLKSPGRISAVIRESYGQDAMRVLDV